MKTSPEEQSDDLALRVLGRIERERVVPRPRWEFVLKNYFFWMLGALAVVLGALSFSMTLFRIGAVDWRFSSVTHANLPSFLFAAVPFLWIGVFTLFIFIGYGNIRRTNRGYRYTLLTIALGSMLMSLTIGTGLYVIGFGHRLDEAIGDHPPFYRPALAEEGSWWLAPERGLLIGQITGTAPDATSFVLRDLSGRSWQVEGGELQDHDRTIVMRGGMVRTVGVPARADSSTFHACFVFPWKVRGNPFDTPMPTFPVGAVLPGGISATTTPPGVCEGIRPYRMLRNFDETRIYESD